VFFSSVVKFCQAFRWINNNNKKNSALCVFAVVAEIKVGFNEKEMLEVLAKKSNLKGLNSDLNNSKLTDCRYLNQNECSFLFCRRVHQPAG